MARQPHEPTPDQRAEVRMMATDGVSQERIAKAMGISKPTLAKHYAEELRDGLEKWEALFEGSIKRRVMRADCPPALVIFVAKVALRWRETTPVADDGPADLDSLSNDELAAIVARRARSGRGGGSGPAPVAASGSG